MGSTVYPLQRVRSSWEFLSSGEDLTSDGYGLEDKKSLDPLTFKLGQRLGLNMYARVPWEGQSEATLSWTLCEISFWIFYSSLYHPQLVFYYSWSKHLANMC